MAPWKVVMRVETRVAMTVGKMAEPKAARRVVLKETRSVVLKEKTLVVKMGLLLVEKRGFLRAETMVRSKVDLMEKN